MATQKPLPETSLLDKAKALGSAASLAVDKFFMTPDDRDLNPTREDKAAIQERLDRRREQRRQGGRTREDDRW